MSRIGKAPVVIPKGVEVNVSGSHVAVKGPKGKLEFTFEPVMTIKVEDGEVLVSRPDDDKHNRSLHGMTRAIINNMVTGVNTGFQKELNMVGVGYKANLAGKKLVVNAGYSHPVEMEVEAGLEVEVPKPTVIIVKGIDKQQVGAFAANVRSIRLPEPYKGKGIKYDDEHIRRKVGKTGSK